MKKTNILCAAMALIIACVALFAGCGNDGKQYTIQYTDDAGVHTLNVTGGMPYSLETVPERTGYVFLGLFDAEVGGTQYVSASGSSLAPFKGKTNLVLFPQYKAKEYTVILDYGVGAVTGERQFTVAYGESLPELPKNSTAEHKVFTGWYTEAECGGTQVADEYGLVPLVSVMNEQNFDLDAANIKLYAGFEAEKHTVTFHFEAGTPTEEMRIPYDTPISNVVPETRVNGDAVLLWSKTQGGEVWNGKVTQDMTLYAVEYAPVIELDSNGGSKVTPVVARPGTVITLPTPAKDLAKFLYWEDLGGNKYTSTTMPVKSTALKAVWQAKLVFEENGGTDVEDISEAAGTDITLPAPEKEGYIFAGWYTADKEQFTSTTMPAAGVALKAGWYTEQSKNVVVISSASKSSSKVNRASVTDMCYKIQYGDYSSSGGAVNIKLKGHVKIKSTWAEQYGAKSAYLEVYSQKSISSSYLLARKIFDGVTGDYREFTFDINLNIADDTYLCFYHECPYDSWTFNLSDFYYTIHYPDTAKLYL